MKLKVKDVNLSSGGPLIAIMHEDDAAKLDLYPLDRIKISRDNKKAIAVVDISKKGSGVEPGVIGLFKEVLNEIKIKDNSIVDIEVENKPESIEFIKKKLQKHCLDEKEMNQIIKDAIENKLSDVELTYFVAASYINGLNVKEIVGLTKAIVNNSSKIELGKKILVDKHCIGGVPGNRTTMIIVPIIAAAGLPIVKASSRAITSAAGTADAMEVLTNVNLDVDRIKKIVNKTNGCIAWGGGAGLASGDDIIIRMEHPLKLDPEGMLLSSILAKKKAVGSTHVLIDIPFGKGAKVESRSRANRLKRLFVKVGRKLGIKIKVVLTNGSSPIGRGIGASLEAKDVIYVLTGDNKMPLDLKKKSVMLAGLMLKMAGKGNEKTALEILESGKAYEKFKEIIKAQDGTGKIKVDDIRLGKYSYVVKAKKNGVVANIDNKAVASICRIAGAPKDKEAGIYLNKQIGESVRVGDALLTVYSDNSRKLNYTISVFNSVKVVEVK